MTGRDLFEKAKKIKGWNATRVAEMMGISRENLTNKFKREEPSINFITDLAKATEMPLSYFLSEETEPESIMNEPEATYKVAGKPLPLYVIEVQKELIDVQRDNIKDKATLMALQSEKIQWLVNEQPKVVKKR